MKKRIGVKYVTSDTVELTAITFDYQDDKPAYEVQLIINGQTVFDISGEKFEEMRVYFSEGKISEMIENEDNTQNTLVL